MRLHEWAVGLKAWREPHGQEGGEVNASTPVMEEMRENIGAVVMGRNMFGGHGAWDDHPWDGWWGTDPPFHTPVFVVTHHPREPLEMQGATTFHFVTDGVESAIARAKEAAGARDVSIGGGASVVRQALVAGLLDELTLNVVPTFLGGGARLLDGLGDADIALACTRVIEAPAVTHLTYRVER